MRDFIQRNKDERLRKKVRETLEFRRFENHFIYVCKIYPQPWYTKILMRYLPDTKLSTWLYNSWKLKMINGIEEHCAYPMTIEYFNRMLKYL